MTETDQMSIQMQATDLKNTQSLTLRHKLDGLDSELVSPLLTYCERWGWLTFSSYS